MEHPIPVSSPACRPPKVASYASALIAATLFVLPKLLAQTETPFPPPSSSTIPVSAQDANKANHPESDSPDDTEDAGRKVSGLAVIDKVFTRSPDWWCAPIIIGSMSAPPPTYLPR